MVEKKYDSSRAIFVDAYGRGGIENPSHAGLGDRLVDCEELPVEVPLPPSVVVYHPTEDGRLYEHTRLQSGELRVVDRQPVVYVLVAAPTEWYEIRERSIHAAAGNVVDDDTLLSAAHVALLAERPQPELSVLYRHSRPYNPTTTKLANTTGFKPMSCVSVLTWNRLRFDSQPMNSKRSRARPTTPTTYRSR